MHGFDEAHDQCSNPFSIKIHISLNLGRQGCAAASLERVGRDLRDSLLRRLGIITNGTAAWNSNQAKMHLPRDRESEPRRKVVYWIRGTFRSYFRSGMASALCNGNLWAVSGLIFMRAGFLNWKKVRDLPPNQRSQFRSNILFASLSLS